MAYSKNPEFSTYQTKPIPLISELNSRGSTTATDVDYLNCYVEYIKNKTTQQQEMSLRKRWGSTSLISLVNATTRGWYYWEDQAKLFIAQSDDIYVYSIPSGTLSTTLNTVFPTTTSGPVGFTEFLYDNGTVKLVVTDGTTLSTIDTSNTVVAGADADMPAHLTSIVYLDGYLFMVKSGTSDLYNSNLNDPLAYTTDGFTSSEMFPDKIVDVRKLNNYIVVFGTDSVEYFWDAANETGSPLQRNDTPIKLAGLIGGIAQLGNKIYFIGDNNKSEASIFVMEDFKVNPISNESLRRWLTANTSSTLYANIVSMDGHDFYVLYTGSYTYVMELETGLWHRWGWQDDASFNLQFAINCRTTTSYTPVFILNGVGTVYKFDVSLYQDAGSAVNTTWITDNAEFDTFNRKSMSSLTLWADKPTSSSSVLIQWSDDDYQNYTTGVSVDLYQECPRIYRLGSFRRRAFKFTHTANQPLRIKKVEVDINIGQS
jgi:hypothetical protein